MTRSVEETASTRGHTVSRGGNSVYLDTARQMLRDFGKGRAKRKCIQARDQNSPGTVSYAFHNAVLKAIEALTDDQRLGKATEDP